MENVRIAVEEWELYNNGILACAWFDLANDTIEGIEEYFTELKEKYGLNDDLELFVADYEDETGLFKHLGETHPEAYFILFENLEDLDDQDLKKNGFFG